MRLFNVGAVVVALLYQTGPSIAAGTDDKKTKDDEPCTVHSPHTGAFFNLNPISLSAVEAGKKAHKDQREESWHAKGYDYPANFTLNVCAPVVEKLDHVVGVPKYQYKNVSAYYQSDGKTYSIGYVSYDLVWTACG